MIGGIIEAMLAAEVSLAHCSLFLLVQIVAALYEADGKRSGNIIQGGNRIDGSCLKAEVGGSEMKERGELERLL
jgi:hypothetical protein